MIEKMKAAERGKNKILKNLSIVLIILISTLLQVQTAKATPWTYEQASAYCTQWYNGAVLIGYPPTYTMGIEVCSPSTCHLQFHTSQDYPQTTACRNWDDPIMACCSCTPTTWSPPTSDYCAGVTFTQTSNCGNTRQATGTATGCNCGGTAPTTTTGTIIGPSSYDISSYTPNTWIYSASATTATPCEWKCDTAGYIHIGDGCCELETCESLGKECASWDDGCGGTADCGACGVDEHCDDGICKPFIDIGLRVYDGSQIVSIAVEPFGVLTSPLRIAKWSSVYGIVLVDPLDSSASGLLIKTSSGIKSLRKYP